MFFRTAVDEFLTEQYISGNTKNTISDYAVKLGLFEKYLCSINFVLSPSVTDIDYDVLFGYIVSLRKDIANTVTVQSYVRSLRAFLNWCYERGYVSEDYCQRFKLPKARKHYIDVLTDSEIDSLYSCFLHKNSLLNLRNRCIVSLMLDSGLRLDEVVTAQRAKLHLVEHYLIVTGKGNKQRAVSFGNSTAKSIRAYLQQCPRADPLFLQADGSPISRDTIKNLFRRLKKKTGIDRLHPHLLRHTFATRFLENGGSIFDLKELLGHTTLKQVQAYLHLSKTRVIRNFERFSPLDNIKKAHQ